MSIERTYYCENKTCAEGRPGDDNETPCNAKTASPPPYLPSGFLEVRSVSDGVEYRQHFCGWDCLMKHAATHPAPIIIPWDEALGMGDNE